MSDAATKLALLEAAIRKEASREAERLDEAQSGEGFVADDWFGGNIDDAYEGGLDDGETRFARDLLAIIETPA